MGYLFMIQNKFLIDTNAKMWTEITDIVIFRKKLLKFWKGVSIVKSDILYLSCMPT